MKKKILITTLLIFNLLLVGCNNNKKFELEEKYYDDSEFIELSNKKLDKLIEYKESFAVFIYQPLCVNSYNFNKMLTEFSETYELTIYKIAFSNIKNSKLKDEIKYYPSFIIFKDGKIVDFLDSSSNDDTDKFKNIEDFTTWFESYVIIKEKNDDINEIKDNDDDIENISKIDAKLDNIKYNKDKINIYFFWGDGCPHCEKEFEFFDSIEDEYGDYFVLNTFEVWHNKENEKLLNQFANAMGDEVSGVPYTIIGEKTFSGFSETYEKDILDAIKNQYQNSYDVYFDKSLK